MSDSPHGISALIDKKLKEERKLIVDWLRDENMDAHTNAVWDHGIKWALLNIASTIERGEYRKGEGE